MKTQDEETTTSVHKKIVVFLSELLPFCTESKSSLVLNPRKKSNPKKTS